MKKTFQLYGFLFFLVFLGFSNVSYAQLDITISNIRDACDNDGDGSIDDNGSVDITVTGSVGTITVNIFGPPNSTFNPLEGETFTVTGLLARNYFAIAQDDVDTDAQPFIIGSINSDIVATVDGGSPINNSSCLVPNGSIDITVAGGSGAGFTFAWTGNNGFTATTEDITGLAGGTYQVEVFDNGTNCSEIIGGIVVTDPSPTIFNISNASPPDLTVCETDDIIVSLDGSESGLPAGESVAYTILVNGNPVVSSTVTVPDTNPGNPIDLTLTAGNFVDEDELTVRAVNNSCAPVLMNGIIVLDVINTPDVDDIPDQSACDAFILPAITGTNLTGNESYFTATGGPGGTGTPLAVGASITTTSTIFIYDETGTVPNCFDEESFTITINATPDVDDIADQTLCDAFILPAITGTNLTGNESYFTATGGPGGTGTPLAVGASITTTSTIFIYDETGTVPNCFDEESFTITIIDSPDVDDIPDQSACDAFILPAITGTNLTGNESYFTATGGPGGTGTPLAVGASITTTSTIFIYDETGTVPNCFDEESFTITIIDSPDVDDIADQTLCDVFILPAITGTNLTGNESYFTATGGPGGTGTPLAVGASITTTSTIFIYDETGTVPNCFDEESFTITINATPDVDDIPDQSACDAFILPAITGTNLTGNESYFTATGGPGGTGTPLAVGASITTTSTIFIYDETGTVPNCFDEESFTITIIDSPDVDDIPDQSACDAFILPAITGTNLTGNESYFTATGGPGGTGTPLAVGASITTTSTIFIYDETGTVPNCFDEESFTITINATPDVDDIADQTLCDAFILPAITGTNLTGNESYFTATGGPGGTGTPLAVGASITTTSTIFIYDETGTVPNCFDEESFTITIIDSPDVDDIPDQSACDAFILPAITGTNLTGNESYFTATGGPGGTGTPLAVGASITTTSTIFIYDETGTVPNCFDEESFTITIIDSPDVDDIADQTLCDVFILPAITGTNLTGNESYFTATGGPGGTGTPLAVGASITTTSTIFIYDETGTVPNCFDEESFTITINATPDVDDIPDQSACDAFILPAITGTNLTGNESYFTATGGPGGTGTPLAVGASITTTSTIFIYDETGTVPNCFDEESFTITIIDSPDVDDIPDQSACDAFILPAITGTNLTGNESYFTATGGPGGTGTPLAVGASITTTSTIFIYDETGTVPNCFDEESFTITINATPDVDDIADQTLCDAFILPAITGTNLTGNESYFTATGGPGGTGTPLAVGASITTTSTIFIYDETGTVPNCFDEESFTITIIDSPDVDDIPDQSACDAFILPAITGTNLTGNESYFTATGGPGGTGTPLAVGASITTTSTIFIYDETGTVPNCFDEESFTITIIDSPDVDDIADQTLCDVFILPAITGTNLTGNESYFTATGGPGGTGTPLAVGASITTTSTIFIYDETGTVPNCFDEESFTITINATPDVDDIPDQSACDAFILPAITGTNLTGNESYFTATGGPGGTGTPLAVGASITTTSTIFIYDETGTVPNCFDEESFTITIIDSPDVDDIPDQSACDAFILPAITGTNLTGNESYFTATGGPGGTGTPLAVGASITTASTIFIYDETGTVPNCFDEESFTITINATPDVDDIADQLECGSFTLPAITGSNLTGNEAYFTASGGVGSQFNAGDIITTTTTLFIYDETGTTPNCFDEESFTITIDPILGDEITSGTVDWIGYVYDDSNDPAPITPVPLRIDYNTTKYRGFITESENFDRDYGNGAIVGSNSCINFTNDFSIRYRLTKNFTPGFYEFTVGGDDGYRLSLDGGATYIIDEFRLQSFRTTTVSICLSGSRDMVLEYFERGSQARVSFNNTLISAAPTAVVSGGGDYCIGSPSPDVVFTFTGTGPFGFTYTDGTNTFTENGINSPFTINNPADGTYSILALGDVNGCFATDLGTSVSVTENPLPTGVVSGGGTVCTGETLPDVTFTFTGTAPFDFTFTDGVNPTTVTDHPNNTFVINNAAAGTYSLTSLLDDNGCVATDLGGSVDVIEIPLPILNAVGTDVTTCGASDGTITLTVTGGSGDFSFAWSSPGGFSSNVQNLTGLVADVYTVIVTDNITTCMATVDVTISEPINFVLTASATGETGCEANDGTASVNIIGGSGDFTILWNGPNGFTSNLQTLANLEPGTYTVQVTDNVSGCIDDTFVIISEAAINFTLAAVGTDVTTCGASDGTIDLTVTGGSGNFTFAWTSLNGFTASTEDLTGLSADTYTVEVTDNVSNCVDMISVTISEPINFTLAAVGTDVTTCGASDGTIDLTVTGGSGNFTFAWTSLNGFTSSDEDLTGLSADTYTVEVTDNVSNCVDMISVTISEPINFTLAAVGTDVTTCGASDGTIDLTVTGGSGNFTFAWTSLNGFTASTEDLTGLSADTYTVEVTDNVSNCVDMISVVINEPINFTLAAVGTDVTTCGASDGTIDLTVTGGSGNFTFAWTSLNGITAATEDLTGLSADTYTVEVTDNVSNCVDMISVTISEPINFTLAAIGTDVTTCGASDGTIDLTVTGGSGNFTFAWTSLNGFTASTEDLTGLSADTYTVEVTDNVSNCVDMISVTISEPINFTLAAVGTDVTTCGASDGTIDLTVTGGSGNFTFAWTSLNGFTSSDEDLTGLSADTYTVTVTDNVSNCVDMISVTISEPINFTLAAVGTDVTTCGASDGTIDLTVTGGSGNFTFAWTSLNGFTAATEDLTGLSTDTYTVEVTDNVSNCVDMISVTISEPINFTLAAVGTDVTTCGASDGTIDLTVTGGSGNFTFAWTSLNGFTSSDEDLTGLSADTYTVTVTDNVSNCVDMISVTISEPINFTLAAVGTDVTTCGASDGTIDLTVTGGSGNFTFSWTSLNGFTAATEDLTGLSADTYTVEVTDNVSNCVDMISVVINEPINFTLAAVGTDVTTCGASDGTIDLTVTGGSGNFTFAWTSLNGFTASTEDLTGLSADTYTVEVTDNVSNCVDMISVTISEPINFTLAAVGTDVTTCGASDGTIDLTVTGGSGNFTFAWTSLNGFTSSDEDLTGLSADTYTVEVTDNVSNCVDMISVTISEPINFTLAAVGTDVTTCGASDGTIDLTVTGGSGNFTFAWTSLNGFTASTEDLTGLSADTYTVEVTDNVSNCVDMISVVINEPINFTLAAVGTDVTTCGASDGTIDLTVTGGSGNFTFAWTSLNGITASTEDLTGLSADTYTVEVTDNVSNCVDMISVTISEPINFTLAAIGTDVTTCGASDGTIDLTVTGGSGNFTFAWTSLNGFTAATEDLTGLSADTYTVEVTDNVSNCVDMISVTISEPINFTLAAVGTDVTTCGANDGTIDLTVTGGSGNFTFSWTSLNGFTAATEDLTGLSADTYTVEVTDNVSNCVDMISVVINEPINFTLAAVGTDVTTCGASDGTIDLTVTGGSGNFTFAWTSLNGFTASTEDLTGLSADTYTVEVTDNVSNCVDMISVTISEPINFTLAAVGTDVTTCGASDGTIDLTVTGGSGNFTFAWTSLNGFTSSDEDLTGLSADTYTVEVTDNVSNCVDMISVTISEPINFTLAAVGTDVTTCGASDGTIDLTVTGGSGNFTFAWTSLNGFTSSDEDLTGLSADTYTVTVTDNVSNCVDMISVTISEPINFTLAAVGTDVTTCGASDGTIDLTVTGGSGNFTFAWTSLNGFTAATEDLTGLSTDTYTVEVTDNVSNCVDMISVTISEPINFTLAAVGTDVTTCGASDGTIDLTVTGGSGNFTFAWTSLSGFTSSDEDLTGLSADTYTVTVTDNVSNCVDMISVTISEPINFTLAAVGTDVTTCGASDGTIDLTVTGGSGNFTFSWTSLNGFTASTEDLAGLSADTYTVEVTDNVTTCTEMVSVIISEPINFTLSVVGTDIVNCGAPEGAANLTVTGGSGNFTFLWSGPGGFTSTLEDISGLTLAGDYSVFVTDITTGCTASIGVTINQPIGCGGTGCSAFSRIEPIAVRPFCQTVNTGELRFVIEGGSGNYLVEMVDSQGNPFSSQATTPDTVTFLSLSPEVYTYTVTDVVTGDICDDGRSFTLEVQTTVEAELVSFTNTTCFDEPGGTATIRVTSGGNAPFFYGVGSLTVSTQSGSQFTFQNLAPSPDPISLLVGDSPNDPCPAEVLVTISNQFAEIDFMTMATPISDCDTNDGAITVAFPPTGGSNGPTEPWEISFDDPNNFVPFATTEAFVGLPAGDYTIYVRDNSGCVQEQVVDIAAPNTVEISVSPVDASCTNNGNSGALVISVTDRFAVPPPYILIIADGDDQNANIIFQDDNYDGSQIVRSELPTGTYSVTVDPVNNDFCPSKVTQSILGGPIPVSYDDVLLTCAPNSQNRVLSISGITGDFTKPFDLIFISAGAESRVTNIDISTITGEATINDSRIDATFLRNAGIYTILLSQEQDVCPGEEILSERTVLDVPPNLSVNVEVLTTSIPDLGRENGSIRVTDFVGGDPFRASLRLDVPAISTSNFETTDFELVEVNNNFNFEKSYDGLPAGQYTVFVVDSLGCEIQEIATVALDSTIFIPNVFSPNGDGVNDTFFIRNIDPDNSGNGGLLVVTNRWGNQVFMDENYTGDWDGEGLADGVYFYKVEARGEVYVGWVEIIRGVDP